MDKYTITEDQLNRVLNYIGKCSTSLSLEAGIQVVQTLRSLEKVVPPEEKKGRKE